MPFLNSGIGLSSLVGKAAVTREVKQLAEIQNQTNVPNAYSLTSSGKGGIALIEAQQEDNTTFLFEYRAYLNSQLTTLITKLTNALTSDLDTVMTDGKIYGKSVMQGNTSTTAMDPGAGRVTKVFLETWSTSVSGNATPGGGMDSGWANSSSGPSSWSVSLDPGVSAAATGTLAVTSYNNAPSTDPAQLKSNDSLLIDYQNLEANKYAHTKARKLNILDEAATAADGGNKFQEVLFKESRSASFRSILKGGLMKDVVIAASTSLPTGSQVQASFTLNGRFSNASVSAPNLPTLAANQEAAVDIFINKFSAFYHT